MRLKTLYTACLRALWLQTRHAEATSALAREAIDNELRAIRELESVQQNLKGSVL